MRRALADAEAALTRVMAGANGDECESNTLDFKEDRGSSSDTEKVIAAAAICFANSAGGAIVLGVSDKLRGRDAVTGTMLTSERIKQRIYELTKPHLVVDIHTPSAHTSVRIILVPQSAEIHSDTQGRATQRINKDCVTLDPVQLSRLREERRGVDWSAEASGRPLDDITSDVINAVRSTLLKFNDYRRDLALLTTADLLSAVGGLHSRGELNRAADLMFAGMIAAPTPK